MARVRLTNLPGFYPAVYPATFPPQDCLSRTRHFDEP
jgi:hypothetical protein